MKKVVFLLAAIPFLTGGLLAQNMQLTDGAFQYWKKGITDPSAGSEEYDDLADPFWMSLNTLATLPPDMFTGPVTLFKDAGRSGAADDFAPRMVSNFLEYGQGQEIFLPGVVGAFDILIESQSAKFGRPFTSRPMAIRGYMKYVPVNGDSASIFVELYKYDHDLGMRRIIGRVEQIYKEEVGEWTAFDLPITYRSEEAPDSISVLFVSSAGYDFENLFNCKGQIESTLWVDDVEFVYGGVGNESCHAVLASSELYPNPSANGIFNLNVKEACRMEVVSLSGQVLFSTRFPDAGRYTVDLSRYVNGVYFLRLGNSGGTAVLKAVRR